MLALKLRVAGLAAVVAAVRANLLDNGGFNAPLPTGDAIDASRVTGERVLDFPGPSTIAAMQLNPSGRSRVVMRSSSGSSHLGVGFYRCTGWSYATSDYNGAAPELTVVLVDGSDAPVPLAATFSATLASGLSDRRDQWIYFDEWVPSNVISNNRVRLTFAPGHTSGMLQLAQLSVTWATFADRERFGLEAIEIWRPNGVYAASVECTLNLFGPGECPDSYGSGAQLRAFDGALNTAFYASHLTVPTVALEIDLGSTVDVCGLLVNYCA
jgi:hypothetical protein